MKKVFVLFLSLMLVLAFTVPTFADERGASSDKGKTVKISEGETDEGVAVLQDNEDDEDNEVDLDEGKKLGQQKELAGTKGARVDKENQALIKQQLAELHSLQVEEHQLRAQVRALLAHLKDQVREKAKDRERDQDREQIQNKEQKSDKEQKRVKDYQKLKETLVQLKSFTLEAQQMVKKDKELYEEIKQFRKNVQSGKSDEALNIGETFEAIREDLMERIQDLEEIIDDLGGTVKDLGPDKLKQTEDKNDNDDDEDDEEEEED